jgi:hypothetical protein
MSPNPKWYRNIRPVRLTATASLFLACGSAACGSSTPDPSGSGRVEGQSDFTSGLPQFGFGERGTNADTSGGGALPPSAPGATKGSTAPDRQVEETDLYRLEGDRLYYLNGYRGLLIFDMSDVDHPKQIGRSPIYGRPVEMIVRGGIATVVVADWFGTLDDGSPFRGSVVRGIDARDPANIQILGEAKLGGWVRDTRVVGDVLYAVSEEYGWSYGWLGADVAVSSPGGGGVRVGGGGVAGGNKVVVSSVSFANGVIQPTGRFETPGWGGIFNVTANAILFAHDIAPVTTPEPSRPSAPTEMALEYLDISDPGGAIALRGSLKFDGHVVTSGTDAGRWNLDFADGKTAYALGCASGQYCGGGTGNYLLAVANFADPDAPAVLSSTSIPSRGWSPATRFDRNRMYLAPGEGYGGTSTPILVYDLSDPKAPKLAGQTEVTGSVWSFTPAGDRLFALGNEGYDGRVNPMGSQIVLRYLDVTDPTKPSMMGAPAKFGEGWAWTPAAGTFKAFTKNDAEGLVVLPFSGYSQNHRQYHNGLQLIEFTPSTVRSAGAARTKGWVERGIFVKNRLVSLSDLSLAVVNYASHDAPEVVAELTLARNVVDAQPHGATIAQLSSDWWYQNDQEHSALRILPIEHAEENVSGTAIDEIAINGVDARVFHNETLSYVVSNVRKEVACPTGNGGTGGRDVPPTPGGTAPEPVCYAWGQEIQVVDFSGGNAVLRGNVALPERPGYYYGGGFGFRGCMVGDWYEGPDAVQVGGDILAFRRWMPGSVKDANGAYVDAYSSLYVVDLANPDQPAIASTVITSDPMAWWGNLKAVGTTLYATHYEYQQRPTTNTSKPSDYVVKYYLNRIDLSDRKHPKVGAKINVPGILVGGSESDPSLIYTIDYRWVDNHGENEFDVLRLSGNRAVLQSSLPISGYVGRTFLRGNKAYMSVQQYTDGTYTRSTVRLYQLDLTNPKSPSRHVSQAQKGWGWLLGVEGDRALVTSGWGEGGIDVYVLSDAEPRFDRFVRTVGYSAHSTARVGDRIYLAGGQWGVQTIDLK